MRAAKARWDIVIEQKLVTKDPDYNSEIITWVTFLECSASITAVRGREFFEASQRFPERVTRFEARWEDAEGVTEDMRIRVGMTIYAIKAILPDFDRRRTITIDASTGTGNS